MKTALICALLSLAFVAPAQNRLLVMQPGDNIGSIRAIDNDGYMTYDYQVPPPPSIVKSTFPFRFPYSAAANDVVQDFQFQHLESHYINEQYALNLTAHQVVMGYASFEYTTSEDWQKRTNRVKQELLSNKLLQEAMYTWLIPVYQQAFAAMSVPEQNDYLTIFNNAVAYLDTFNLAKEKAAADEAEYADGEEMYDFLNTRGKLNAFIYRRISKNELTKEECRSWLQRIIKDFEAVKTKNPTEADHYVLTDILNYGYALGALYNKGGYDYFGEKVLMRKTGNSFAVLPPQFDRVNYIKGDLVVGHSPDTSKALAFLVYDSSGYTYSSCDKYGYCYQHKILGDERNKRIMMVSGWDNFPDEKYGEHTMAYCWMVDADSGTIVRDTFLLRTEVDGGYYTDNYKFPGFDPQHIIYYDIHTKLYGMMDEYGNQLLPPKYSSIEATEEPDQFKVNGRKKIRVRS